MGLFIRFTFCFAVIMSSFVGVSWAYPQWARDLGIDFWRLPELSCAIHQEEERLQHLKAEHAHVVERSKAKVAILEQLIEGKIDLKTAAEKIYVWCDDWFLTKGLPNMPVKGTTQKERFCRVVVHWVEMLLRHRRISSPEQVLSRLEAQLPEAIANISIKDCCQFRSFAFSQVGESTPTRELAN